MAEARDHLAWAKARALEYLDGDPYRAGLGMASFISDLSKDEAWARRPGSIKLVALLRDFLAKPTAANARDLIEKFDG